jgi:hypothetical protein
MNRRRIILHIFSKWCEHVERMEDNALMKDPNHRSCGKNGRGSIRRHINRVPEGVSFWN